MSNIIVCGTRRTGTSLMVEMIAKNDNYVINKNDKDFRSNIKNIQPYLNEGLFVDGINESNSKEYLQCQKNVIKLLNNGLLCTDLKYFDSFKKIILMNRNWITQVKSNKNLYKLNAENFLKDNKTKVKITDKDEFIKDYSYNDGIEYGYYYSWFIFDILKRNYKSKIIIINFEDLINNLNKVNKILKKHNLGIENSYKSVDKTITKFNNIFDKRDLVEFKEGYFEYLDTLYNCIRFNSIDNNLIKLIQYWIPIIETNIKERETKIYKKYNIVLSSDLPNQVNTL